MGNQGMTNWKFIAFFAISLMLVAGVFTNAAIAANGDGKVSVRWVEGSVQQDDTVVPGTIGETTSETPLPAASTMNSLQFTFDSLNKDMRGGAIRIKIPNAVDGWKINKKAITVYDSADDSPDETDRIFLLRADGEANHNFAVGDDIGTEDLTEAEKAASGRVTVTASGPPDALVVTSVEVTFTRNWGTNNGRSLIVLFQDVTAAVPDRLNESDAGTLGAYMSYEFGTRSRADGGVFTRLKPYNLEDDTNTAADESLMVNRAPQPRVAVGNVRDGAGETTLDPAVVYIGDKAVFDIVFTAAGPMYDHNGGTAAEDAADTDGDLLNDDNDINSVIQLNIPENLRVEDVDEDSDFADDFAAKFKILTTTGSTRLAIPRYTTVPAPAPDNNGIVNTTITAVMINVVRMKKGDRIELEYTVDPVGTPSGANKFTVQTRSRGNSVAALSTPEKDLKNAADEDIMALSFQKTGSGTLAISPSPVLVNRKGNFTLIYTAPADMGTNEGATAETDNVYLRIAIPAEIDLPMDDADPPLITFDPTDKDHVTVTSGTIGSRGDAYRIGDGDLSDENARQIAWKISHLKAGDKFGTVVKNVKVSTAGAFPWEAYVSHGADGALTSNANFDRETDQLQGGILNDDSTAGMTATLYVVQSEVEDVLFEMDPTSFSAAATKQTIEFTFTADSTPIENGAVWFKIPGGWTKPVAVEKGGEGDVGEVTALINDAAGEKVKDIAKEDIKTGYTTMIEIDELKINQSVVVTYKNASIQPTAADGVEVSGHYNARSTSLSSRVTAGTEEVDITNVVDGTGTAEIKKPLSVKAGSSGNLIEIEYKPVGTMDNGSVSLTRPAGWSDMQRDPEKAGYIDVRVNGRSLDDDDINTNGSIVVAYLEDFDHRNRLTFMYGGGSGSARGVKVQDDTGFPFFVIEARGSGAGRFDPVRGVETEKTADKDLVRQVFVKKGGEKADENGKLRIEVTGGEDGTGSAAVDITRNKAGSRQYVVVADDGTESTEDQTRVHAGDDSTYITFTYKAAQPITDGLLEFIVPIADGWSKPQESDRTDGYTAIVGPNIEPAEFDNTDSVSVKIIALATGGEIKIHYGSYAFAANTAGGAKAPEQAIVSRFTIKIKGSEDGSPEAIDGTADNPPKPLTVMVYPQASGGGSAMIRNRDDLNLRSGDASKSLQIVYTADGEIDNGQVQLTIPDDWSMATSETVEVSRTGAVWGGDLDADGLDEEGITDMQVLVKGVNLSAEGTITFTYTGMVQPAEEDDVQFKVASDGGAGPGEGVIELEDLSDLTVDVGGAGAGSGDADVDPKFVTVGDVDVALTVTYTAAGEVGYPRIFSVTVDSDWIEPTIEADKKGTYTVKHLLEDGTDGSAVEILANDGQEMRARVVNGGEVAGGDMVVFTYTADAPAETGTSRFAVSFDGSLIDTVTVNIQPGSGATDLMVMAPESLKTEDGPVMITLQLSAEDDPASSEDDVEISLSSSSATGMFSDATGEDAEYTAELMVTITAGKASAMVYYMDSTLGMSIITAVASPLTNPDGTATISVDTALTEVTEGTVDVTPSMAKEGTPVTVMADGTPNQDATFAVEGIIFDDGTDMDEVSSGSYSGSFMVAAGVADGTYDVTVNLNGAVGTLKDALTIDNTVPNVTVSDIEGIVANGDEIMISAAVDDGDGTGVASVMADVSMLDTEADPVELTDADGDGTYTRTHTISTENGADNGTHTITVTAMDAVGNNSEMATAMVTLQNSISFTSMIPTGANLFHVPLNDPDITTVGDLRKELGDAVSSLIVRHDGGWEPDSDGVMVTSDLGIYLVATAGITHTFEGDAWEDTTLSLEVGANLVGLPVNDPGVAMVSDIIGLFDEGVIVGGVTIGSGSEYAQISNSDDSDDTAVQGDAAYYIVTSAAGSATLTGDGWDNGDAANAAPIALSGYRIENQAPALAVYGSVLDELTGVAREGFRVKVKNLSTKAALSEITSVEAADGYSMAFVDLKDARAARVGDVLEISADSPNPLIGVKLVRHIVTVDDVKNGRITLEDLIAYEIPAETELLRNYPNPFNPETWIPYRLAEDADVSLTIYDVNGAVVRDIDIGHQTAAVYETRAKAIYWDGRNQFGEQVASGLYFYHLSAADFSGTRRMVILK